MKSIIYKVRLYITRILNIFLLSFIRKNQKINIISSKKYKYKVKEDVMLQKYLIKNNIYCKIVAWDDNKFTDNNIIRSVWGYHNNYKNFINNIKNITTINDSKIIINNIDKHNQYNLMEKYNIPNIPTTFTNNVLDIKIKKEKQVVKPTISAGGDNTYIIEKKSDIDKCKNISNIMIQPYIKEIENGELSIIVLGHNIEYGIIRYPGVLSKYKKPKYIDKELLSSDILEIMNKILDIKEYKNSCFMRVDFVEYNKEYKVLEIELTDPDLFIETIPSREKKEEIYNRFISEILKKIKDCKTKSL